MAQSKSFAIAIANDDLPQPETPITTKDEATERVKSGLCDVTIFDILQEDNSIQQRLNSA
jgi:hypothetical protein